MKFTTLKLPLVIYLILSCIKLYGQNKIYYNDYNVSNGLYFEIPNDTILDNRYTIDNTIYYGNREYLLKYSYLKNDINYSIIKTDSKPEWEIITQEDFSVDTNKIVSYLLMEVLPDSKIFLDKYPEYDQSLISYKYFSSQGKMFCKETTGLVENDKNIWFHSPRNTMFKILELNPFPYIKFPCETGLEWEWELEIGSHYGDTRWKSWNGTIINKSHYKIIGKEIINTEFYVNIDCWIVDAYAESELGTTKLKSYFNENKGFIKFEYVNIDNSKIIIEINDIDN